MHHAIKNSPNLFSNPTPCFLLPIMIKCNKSTTMKTKTLLDFGAFTCFIDKELVWQLKLPLVKKITSMAVEVIDGQNLFSSLMMHETKELEITIGSHTSKVVFNVISSLANPSIIGLFWLILHNPWVDWHTRSFHFEAPKEETSKCKALFVWWKSKSPFTCIGRWSKIWSMHVEPREW